MFNGKKIIMMIAIFFSSFLIIKPVLANTAIINEDHLNVRSGPGTEYEKIGQIHSGSTYEIIDESEEWVQIKLEDTQGWVITDFITIKRDETTNEELEKSDLSHITIVHDQTQIRSGNGTEFDIIAFANKGDQFDVIKESNQWLEITNSEETGFVWKELITKTNNRYQTNGIKDKTIVIDPGHGGRDVGAIGISNTYERDVIDFTAQILEAELKKLGAIVISTRPGNEYIPLESRSALASVVDADAFLSLHYNSFPEMPSVTGIETFFYHPQYQSLATAIHNGIIEETGERDRNVSFGDFHVVRQTFKPGALLELGFISNGETLQRLETPAYQRQLVTGMINGLQKYFAQENARK